MDSIEQRTISKVTWRLVPFLILCYFIAYLDRVNVGFAGPTMSKDLAFTAQIFGAAAGIFFIGYFIFEVPSNMALNKFGARVWIARIMFTWGILSGAQAYVTGSFSFNIVRFLLGIAEAGFFPGVIFYLTLWFPSAYRGRIIGWFMFAIPLSSAIGAPISGYILNMDGVSLFGTPLHGWQWLFIIEAIPSLILTFVVLFYLTDRPADAQWLEPEERKWLQDRLDAEQRNRESMVKISWQESLFNPRVIALGFVYMGIVVPLYGLSFFLPQIIKAFGGTNVQNGFINAFPFAIGAVCMVLWGRLSDSTGERKWSTAFPVAMIAVGLFLAASTNDLTMKILAITIASFGIFSAFAVFWTLPTSYLSGAAAAAGIAWINSIGNLGGYIGPQVFGYLKDTYGKEVPATGDFYGIMFLAAVAVIGVVLVLIVGHDPRLERAPEKIAAE